MPHTDRSNPQDDGREEVFYNAGDQCIRQDVFQSYFDQYPRLDVVGVSKDTGRGSLDAAVSYLTPDIVLMGVKYVEPSTVEKMKAIRDRRPEAVIVLLAGDYSPEGMEALRDFSRGASAGYAYLYSDILEKRDQLADTISMAAAGRIIADPSVMDGLLDRGAEAPLLTTLEPWERDVLKLMARSFQEDTI